MKIPTTPMTTDSNDKLPETTQDKILRLSPVLVLAVVGIFANSIAKPGKPYTQDEINRLSEAKAFSDCLPHKSGFYRRCTFDNRYIYDGMTLDAYLRHYGWQAVARERSTPDYLTRYTKGGYEITLTDRGNQRPLFEYDYRYQKVSLPTSPH